MVKNFWRILKKDTNWWKKFPEAAQVHVGSVVITENMYDVGLVKEEENGIPTAIYSRYNRLYGGKQEYGGVTTITWYDTGIRMSVDEWRRLSEDCKDAGTFYRYWEARLKKAKIPKTRKGERK